jgi:hypothetical protein
MPIFAAMGNEKPLKADMTADELLKLAVTPKQEKQGKKPAKKKARKKD